AGDEGLRWIARLREARSVWAQGKADAALALLESGTTPQGGFSSLYHELAGDILVSQDKLAQAREAYELALSNATPAGSEQARLRQKLDDIKLGTAGNE